MLCWSGGHLCWDESSKTPHAVKTQRRGERRGQRGERRGERGEERGEGRGERSCQEGSGGQ